MKWIGTAGLLALSVVLFGCASPQPEPVLIAEPNVLPLELNDDFRFNKVKTFLNEPEEYMMSRSEVVRFERDRLNWGAVGKYEREERTGNYYWFFWESDEPADITFRFEFRQALLGNYVQAQEFYYPAARGSFETEVMVTGDDYLEFGRVTAWRAILIVDGRIVAFTQSFLWK